MTQTYLCANCLSPATPSVACPNCQWEDAKHPEMQLHLPRHYVLLSRYYIGKVLGQGGFGVTYLAKDLKLNRPMAIKEFLPAEQCTRLTDRISIRPHGGDRDEQYAYGLQKFLEEAKALAQFEGHPCIVPISDYAEANGTAYLVMSYLEGVTLKQHLANQGGKIPHATALRIMMPAMDALREVHSRGMLHRDVSPDNIFLTKAGQVKLLDFGAARHAIGDRSQSLSMILKPGFSPEEQYRSKGRQGPWTDVYAVATTLYMAITGQIPPSAPDRLADDELIPPSRLIPDLPKQTEAALMRGLAVKGPDRFQTIDEFQRALLEQPIVPPPPPPPPQPPPPGPPISVQPPVVLAPAGGKTKGRAILFCVGGLVLALFAVFLIRHQMIANDVNEGVALFKRSEFKAALPLLGKGAEAGNAKAETYLAVMINNGDGVRPDFEASRDWAKKAAAQGEGRAMNVLGVQSLYGLGTVRDYRDAREWFQKAADAGEPRGMQDLGLLFENGLGVAADQATAQSWYAKARAAYAEQAESGDFEAMAALGDLYERGKGGAQDFAEAKRWFDKGKAEGNSDSLFYLGRLYEYGDGVSRSFDEARSWYEKAAVAGNRFAMYNLANMFEGGRGGPVDYARAKEWYSRSADAGDSAAMVAMGDLFQNGYGGGRNAAEAKNWYAKAADLGDTYGMNAIGELYAKGALGAPDNGEANRWWKQAADAGNPFAMFNLGYSYYTGRGVTPDLGQAKTLWEQAGALGDGTSMFNLGIMYRTGKGVNQDYSQAFEWFTKSEKAGYARAMYQLYLANELGQGTVQNSSVAEQWLSKAVRAGVPEAKQEAERRSLRGLSVKGMNIN